MKTWLYSLGSRLLFTISKLASSNICLRSYLHLVLSQIHYEKAIKKQEIISEEIVQTIFCCVSTPDNNITETLL